MTEKDPATLVADMEARSRRYETPCGDGALVWRVWGNGPAVVLAHGAFGSWTHWIRNIDVLVDSGRTVIGVDLPGYGESAEPPAYDHATQAAVLAEGLRIVAPDALPVDLIGFSYGGVMLAWMAALYPDLARRLIVIGSGGLDTPLGNVVVGPVKRLEGLERLAAHKANILGLMMHHAESVDAMALHLQEWNGMRGKFRGSESVVMPDWLLQALPRVPGRVDAIWGELDRPHPDPAAQELAIRALRPELDFRVITGAGHWAMYERPDAFNAALLDLLNSH